MNDTKDFIRSFFPQLKKVELPQQPSMSNLLEGILHDYSARLRLCSALGCVGLSFPAFVALFDLPVGAGQKYEHLKGLQRITPSRSPAKRLKVAEGSQGSGPRGCRVQSVRAHSPRPSAHRPKAAPRHRTL
jgi:hypothetical protein